MNVITIEVGKKQRECEADLMKAQPALDAAKEALDTLNKVSRGPERRVREALVGGNAVNLVSTQFRYFVPFSLPSNARVILSALPPCIFRERRKLGRASPLVLTYVCTYLLVFMLLFRTFLKISGSGHRRLRRVTLRPKTLVIAPWPQFFRDRCEAS